MPIVPILEGLRLGVLAATSGVISRPVSVRNREGDGPYEGPFPLVDLMPMDDSYVLIGNVGLGQPPNRPSLYGCVIYDRVQKRPGGTAQVAASQDDVYALHDALVAYFARKANLAL